MMNELEQIIVSFLNDLFSTEAIRKENILVSLGCNCGTYADTIYTVQDKEKLLKVAKKLQSSRALTNTNFTAWLKNNNIEGISSNGTLEECLAAGVFSYKVRKGKRNYYVKDGVCNPVKLEMIMLS